MVESGLNLYDRYKIGSLEKARSYDEIVCIEGGRGNEDNLKDQKVVLQNVYKTMRGFMLALTISVAAFVIELMKYLRRK